jgi:chromosome segregation ATPase
MGEFIQLFNELRGVLGGTLAVGLTVAVYLYSQRGQRKLDGANTEANVSAIAHWKDVAERSDAALIAMTQRADKFAEDRNDAFRSLAHMEGQLAEMTRQLAAQNLQLEAQRKQLEAQSQEMQGLRDQIRDLQEQIHAPR